MRLLRGFLPSDVEAQRLCALYGIRADAVLAASLFHFGELRIDEVKESLAAAGYPVRAAGRLGGPRT